MRTVLNRSFSVIQWEALFLLVCGISINQLPSCQGSQADEPFTLMAAFYTLCSVICPTRCPLGTDACLLGDSSGNRLCL